MAALDTEWADAIVVGSGFGGSVAACRLAEADRSVCVLERGRRYPPGSFPRRPAEMARNFWDPSKGLQGLFDIWSFKRLESVVASGVGGGSLIYANVMLRKDEHWFVKDQGPAGGYESWPVTRDDLEPCYDRAEKMMGALGNTYPYTGTTPKTQAMRRAAHRLGLDWFRPPLAISFAGTGELPGEPLADSSDNIHKASRSSCRLCGECNIGCNYGSKNTLDYTYLTEAAKSGAEIRDRCEVREIRPLPRGGFEVRYVRHHPDNEGQRMDTSRLPRHTMRCRVLVLAAGAIGTSYLLLRNRSAFRGLGPALGTRFNGNGDLLGFVVGSQDRLSGSLGPVITSTVRMPDETDGADGRGFYIQDGGYPQFVDWMLEAAAVAGPAKRFTKFALAHALHGLADTPRSEIGAQVAALVGSGTPSAGFLPMLAMGREIPDGRLRLRGKYLALDWTDATSRRYFARLQATMAALAEQLGGEFQVTPSRYLRRVIASHPLGGAPMGADIKRGVVDDHGEAFGHPGLFVADGAVMPGPVGPNPALTIAALAERFSERMLDRTPRTSLPALSAKDSR